jgi:cysteinyl-tRNA synthetase
MKLYSTLSRTVETFSPLDEVVKMYVCGLTPYSEAHVGHAMRAVVFDVLRRYIEFRGYKVKFVENFTDVDDKMINRAAEEGVSVPELAERNIHLYMEQMEALNVLPAHLYPRATEEIPAIIEMIQGLVDKEIAYQADGDVYFHVRSDPDYGKLSRRDIESMRVGARIEVDEKKHDGLDFALWKAQKPGEPAWDSPWGKGRPGWHIECSAMAAKYLGESFDIHGGGQDLVFPHHENEIAQTESYTGKSPMAQFWMHNGMVELGDEKMSKSLGNVVRLGEALDKHSSDALRLFFLNSHYRSPLVYREDIIDGQERAAERLRYAAKLENKNPGRNALDASEFRGKFTEAMDDDLNTPRALAALFDMCREINRAGDEGRDISGAQATLAELTDVLGLTLEEPAQADSGDIAPLMDLLIETRAGLRKAKQYELADSLRDRLADLGYVLEDSAGGTTWKRG